MYSQANVRAGKWPRPPPRALPSVIVDTEKVLREADGVRGAGRGKTAHGWKGVRFWVRLKNRTVRADEEPEEHKRSIYGAVAAICEEFVGQPDNTGGTCNTGGSINCSWRSQS